MYREMYFLPYFCLLLLSWFTYMLYYYFINFYNLPYFFLKLVVVSQKHFISLLMVFKLWLKTLLAWIPVFFLKRLMILINFKRNSSKCKHLVCQTSSQDHVLICDYPLKDGSASIEEDCTTYPPWNDSFIFLTRISIKSDYIPWGQWLWAKHQLDARKNGWIK